jgi:hypothetical protein
LQLSKPEVHEATTQLPPAHAGVAFGSVHASPQPPQFAASLAMSTQVPSHSVRPGPQVVLQTPLLQVVPAGQTMPQAPQFALSVAVSTQRPPQSVLPAGQVVTQVPMLQTCPGAQALSHMPQ